MEWVSNAVGWELWSQAWGWDGAQTNNGQCMWITGTQTKPLSLLILLLKGGEEYGLWGQRGLG